MMPQSEAVATKNQRLPDGFVKVRSDKQPKITFDANFRFYFSRSLMKEFGLAVGDRVGLAYNPANGSMLIDKGGSAFRIDKRQYISSKEFARANRLTSEDCPVRYVYIPEQSSDEFLVFNVEEDD